MLGMNDLDVNRMILNNYLNNTKAQGFLFVN